jgi:ribosomal protein S18 acetylase RimI-like enzyme
MSNFTVRKATLSDINQLAELFDLYRVFYDKKSDIAAAKEFLSQRIKNNESVIIVTESQGDKSIVGFTQLYPLFSSTRMKRLWLLNDLYVLPDYRSQRCSIQLIDAAKEHALLTNSVGLMLETAKSNDIGNQLYPRCGFELDADHNYYEWSI